MSDELKPCPFCGGGARLLEAVGEAWARCTTCGASSAMFGGIDGAGKAVAAWNARAAVDDEQFATAVHDGRAWQVVRECHVAAHSVNGSDVCESCDLCDFGWHRSVNDKPFGFCPNCGAKVVG